MYDARGGPLRPACKLGWDCHLHHDLALLLVEGVSSMWSRQIQTGGGPSFMGFPLNSRSARAARRSDFALDQRSRATSLSPSRQFLRVTDNDFLAAFRAIASFGRRHRRRGVRARRRARLCPSTPSISMVPRRTTWTSSASSVASSTTRASTRPWSCRARARTKSVGRASPRSARPTAQSNARSVARTRRAPSIRTAASSPRCG